MKGSSVGFIIMVAVGLLMGAILIGIIADNTIDKVQRAVATETLNLNAAIINETYVNETPISLGTNTLQSGFRTGYSECAVSSLASITNESGTAMTSPLHYNFTAASGTTPAKITIATGKDDTNYVNWVGTTNTTTVTYQYCASNYIGGWASTIFKMVPGFFALAVLGSALVVLFFVLKSEGVNIGI